MEMKMALNKEINEKNKFEWLLEMSFSCSKKYEQFINWLRIEYYFLQQDNNGFLTIYFPNGHVKVEKEAETKDRYLSKIAVESKCAKTGLKMQKNLSSFLEYIEYYHRLNQIK